MSKNKEVDLLDVATVFAKRKRIVIWGIFIATLFGLVVALIWPKTYKADLTYVLTDSNSIDFSSGGLLSGLANLSVSGSDVTADQTLIILRGKEIKDEIIKEFNLYQVYDSDIQEELRKKLDNKIEIEEFREGGIGFNSVIAVNVAILDEEPERAYEMVNFYYSKLDSIVKSINKKNIEESFLLLQNRLNQNRRDMQVAEDSLLRFQQRYGILEVEEQAKALIENIAEVKSELVQLEIQISYLEKVYEGESPQLKELKLRKQELDQKYRELVQHEPGEGSDFDIYRSLSEMPELFLEYFRRYREVQVQQEIYKVLYPQYEQQKLNYEEINSGLKIVDQATIPTYKDSPKRAYILIVFFLIGFFVSVLIVLFKEWRIKLENEGGEEFEKYQEFVQAIRFSND